MKLYYSGTRRLSDKEKNLIAPVEYISAHNPGKTLAANPSYSVLRALESKPRREICFLKAEQELFEGPPFLLGEFTDETEDFVV